uniref:Uncharacterized protein n=1 Tax=Siphoviridae sp. ctwQg18 TaxID=2826516 RepID=A0A8S5MIM5_9CAUD|nr:MAG TPA: hypothetical protein [Siphoviridae sp. ctwQg18]DAD82197.1 MAG TPA: hypothetical protein [Siphoviridae sp. ctwQg18]
MPLQTLPQMLVAGNKIEVELLQKRNYNIAVVF